MNITFLSQLLRSSKNPATLTKYDRIDTILNALKGADRPEFFAKVGARKPINFQVGSDGIINVIKDTPDVEQLINILKEKGFTGKIRFPKGEIQEWVQGNLVRIIDNPPFGLGSFPGLRNEAYFVANNPEAYVQRPFLMRQLEQNQALGDRVTAIGNGTEGVPTRTVTLRTGEQVQQPLLTTAAREDPSLGALLAYENAGLDVPLIETY